MTKTSLRNSLISLAVSVVAASAAPAQTIQTFESFSACNATQVGAVQNNLGTFAGINYGNHWTCFGYPESIYLAHSGTNRVYTGLSTSDFAFVGGSVQFLGAWFSGGSGTTTPVSFRMYLGASVVGTSTGLLLTTPSTFLSSGYNGAVDRVEVLGPAGNYVMDDITYASATTAVPEPSSVALMTLALAGVGVLARRRTDAK